MVRVAPRRIARMGSAPDNQEARTRRRRCRWRGCSTRRPMRTMWTSFYLVCWFPHYLGSSLFLYRIGKTSNLTLRIARLLELLLASICWIWFFKSGKGYKEVSIAAHVPWLWPNEDFYLTWVIYLGLFSNSLWLIWLVILDYRTTLWCSCIVATCVSVLICIGRFAICGDVESVCWVHMLGWSAAALAFIGNIFRLVSVEQRDFSLCAFFVAVAGTAPEILWMFNVIFVESGTLFANDGKTIGFWDIFFKRNCHWKASWTLNSLLRFPELVLLIKQIDQAQLCQSLALAAGFCSSIEWPAWKNEALRWVRRERE